MSVEISPRQRACRRCLGDGTVPYRRPYTADVERVPCPECQPRPATPEADDLELAMTDADGDPIRPLHRRAAMAAHLLTEVTAGLLRYAFEGGVSEDFALEPEELAKLAEAFGIVLEIEGAATGLRHANGDDPNGPASISQMQGAIERFREEWR